MSNSTGKSIMSARDHANELFQEGARVKMVLHRRILILLLMLAVFLSVYCYAAAGFTITIDPGHSSAHQGTISCSGTGESEYNQVLSRKITDELSRAAIMTITTTTGQDASLAQRAAMSKGCNLLLSVHHDSVQPQFITVKNDRNGKHYCSQKAQGFSIFVSRRNKRFDSSLRLAIRLGEALVKRGLTPSPHHAEKIPGENRELLDSRLGIYRYDELGVLKAADSPAILLEAAVIVHPDDDKRAQSTEYHHAIAESVREMAAHLADH